MVTGIETYATAGPGSEPSFSPGTSRKLPTTATSTEVITPSAFRVQRSAPVIGRCRSVPRRPATVAVVREIRLTTDSAGTVVSTRTLFTAAAGPLRSFCCLRVDLRRRGPIAEARQPRLVQPDLAEEQRRRRDLLVRTEQPGPHQGERRLALEPLLVLPVGRGHQLVQTLSARQEPLGLPRHGHAGQHGARLARLTGQQVGSRGLVGAARGRRRRHPSAPG